MANLLGEVMDTKAADGYTGVTWETFRERGHAMERYALKVRPADFSESSQYHLEHVFFFFLVFF